MDLTFEVAGLEQVSKVLAAQADRAKDHRPAWKSIANDFAKRESEVFDRQGAVSGWNSWKPINEDYRDWKVSKGWSPKIMVKGGRLMHSLTAKTAADKVFKSRALSMEIGTRVPYAIYHHKPKGKTPKREVIRVTRAQRKFWTDTIDKFLKGP